MAILPQIAVAEEPVVAPVVKATTVVTGRLTTGTTVLVPAGVSLTDADMDLELRDGGTFAFATLARRGCQSKGSALCSTHRILAFATPGFTSHDHPDQFQYGSAPGDEMPAGLYDIYLLSDAAARLTLRFNGAAAGEMTVSAAGEVQAVVQRLSPRCPGDLGGCAASGYASAVHPISRPGLVLATAVAYRTGPGYLALLPCIDPHFDEGSAATRDPLLGCPTLPTEPSSGTNAAEYASSSTVWPGGSLDARTLYNNDPRGEVLAGYMGSAVGVGDAAHIGWGVWLSGGVN